MKDKAPIVDSDGIQYGPCGPKQDLAGMFAKAERIHEAMSDKATPRVLEDAIIAIGKGDPDAVLWLRENYVALLAALRSSPPPPSFTAGSEHVGDWLKKYKEWFDEATAAIRLAEGRE